MAVTRSGTIYMFQCTTPRGHTVTKIGRTNDLRGRLPNYQRQLPWCIDRLWTLQVQDQEAAEGAFHQMIASARENQEWFTIDEAGLSRILQSADWHLEARPAPGPLQAARPRNTSTTAFLLHGVSRRGEVFQRIDVTGGSIIPQMNLPLPTVDTVWRLHGPLAVSVVTMLHQELAGRHTNGTWFQLTEAEEQFVRELTEENAARMLHL